MSFQLYSLNSVTVRQLDKTNPVIQLLRKDKSLQACKIIILKKTS